MYSPSMDTLVTRTTSLSLPVFKAVVEYSRYFIESSTSEMQTNSRVHEEQRQVLSLQGRASIGSGSSPMARYYVSLDRYIEVFDVCSDFCHNARLQLFPDRCRWELRSKHCVAAERGHIDGKNGISVRNRSLRECSFGNMGLLSRDCSPMLILGDHGRRRLLGIK